MSSSANTTTDAGAAKVQDADKQPQQQDGTVTKTVQTVEVRSSAGQPEEEGVLKPIRVVHEIPAKEAKDAAVKQD
ncbi:hypothetical protein EJB05_44274 [Eragrostis curvula]|uniref:Uncharacterized protein n=1 Tax=Eragrostis curvula TaxID=38414 RepID=A0A5J9TIJ6_9POAL|nr:hypothetical protein EJB05_44274 [Eragrostis curvula]